MALTYRKLPLASLLVAAFFFLPHQFFCQEKKLYPDGTTGLVLEVCPDNGYQMNLRELIQPLGLVLGI